MKSIENPYSAIAVLALVAALLNLSVVLWETNIMLVENNEGIENTIELEREMVALPNAMPHAIEAAEIALWPEHLYSQDERIHTGFSFEVCPPPPERFV